MFATVGLLVSPDVSLFIFNRLDASKKRDVTWAIKKSRRTGWGHENARVKTWQGVGEEVSFYELNKYMLKP